MPINKVANKPRTIDNSANSFNSYESAIDFAIEAKTYILLVVWQEWSNIYEANISHSFYLTNPFLFDSIRKVKLAYVYYVHFTRPTYLLFVQSLCDHIDKEKWSFLGIHVMITWLAWLSPVGWWNSWKVLERHHVMRIGLKFNFRMIRQCKESERESDNGAEIFPQNKVEGKWNAWKDARDQNVVEDGRNGAGLMCVCGLSIWMIALTSWGWSLTQQRQSWA